MKARFPRDNPLIWAGPLVAFVLALAFFSWLFVHFPVLYDTDSYYHLAIGRLYAHEGPVDDLPWARLSLMNEGFGDKELLFHALLAPFTVLPPLDPPGGTKSTDPARAALGGRWALAFFNACLVAVLTFFGILALGRWGFVVPWLVYAGSADFLGRVIRLRPELLSLLLLLAAITCVAQRRDRLLGLVTALYTLSYTAFHALLGLCFAWFVVRGWSERRWSPNLVLYPILGAGLGLLLHPGFPHNLAVWKVQSVDFFARKAELNVGLEIDPATTDELLWLNLGWALGLVVLWRAARAAPPREAHAPMAWTLHVATAAFGLLYLLAQRFSIYFVPLATLSTVYEMRRRGLGIGETVLLPGRGRLPLAVALVLVSFVGLSQTATLLWDLTHVETPAELTREEDWAAFGRSVPAGARVAAEWGSTHLYMFWAPQATYLNVLDPVFMALPFPDAYRAARAVFEGREPDIALALEADLASRFLAVSTYHPHADLLRRLADDPRIALRYQGYTSLYEVVTGKNTEFLLDWRRIPPGIDIPPPPGTDTAAFEPYPRAPRQQERALEAFVDVNRFGDADGCVALVYDVDPSGSGASFELAAHGPTSLWLDQRPVLSTRSVSRAVLGAGLRFPVAPLQERHCLTVLTCPDPSGNAGFFLRRLEN